MKVRNQGREGFFCSLFCWSLELFGGGSLYKIVNLRMSNILVVAWPVGYPGQGELRATDFSGWENWRWSSGFKAV
jgi:hypothetical protein